jgi:hypothetical protein
MPHMGRPVPCHTRRVTILSPAENISTICSERSGKPASRSCNLRLDPATPTMTPLVLVPSLKMSPASAIFPARPLGELPADHVHVSLAIGLPGHVFPQGETFPRPADGPSWQHRPDAIQPRFRLLRNCAGQPTSRITGDAARTRVIRRRRRRRRPTGGATGRTVPARYGRSARWPGIPPRCPSRDAPPRHGS